MKKLLGNSPATSIIGLIIAGATAAKTVADSGPTNWWQIALAGGIAIFSRAAADSRNLPK